MTTPALFLRQLSKFIRLCSIQEPFKFTIQKLLQLVRYVGKLLGRVRGRPPGPRPPKTSNEHLCGTLPSSGIVTCYSQVPPKISVLPGSPVLSDALGTRQYLNLSSSRPNSEYLSPWSALGREDGLQRPYARSEPAMSLHRFPSRASSHASSRISTRTRDSRGSVYPSNRSLHRAHVSTGVSTIRTSMQPSEGIPAHSGSLQPDHNETASSTVASSTIIPSIDTMFETSRYERYVKMLVFIYLGLEVVDLSDPGFRPRRDTDKKVLLPPVTIDFEL